MQGEKIVLLNGSAIKVCECGSVEEAGRKSLVRAGKHLKY